MKGKLGYTITRIILGLAFLFFGVTKFLTLPAPELPGPAADFLAAMASTGYMIPLIGIAEVVIGLLLLVNIAVPFSMILLSAIMINVILFNIFLAPSLFVMIMLLVLVALQVYIMYCTWNAYKPLFRR
ncbi:MAG: DoxX family membrane protein [Nanoarchaeota archaeon]